MTTPHPHAPHERAIERLFDRLRSATGDNERQDAARELAALVGDTTSDISVEDGTKLWDESINPRVLDLVASSSVQDQLAGLLAIDYLLQLDAVEMTRSLYRYWNNVSPLFVSPSTTLPVMRAAAHTAGEIVRLGGASFGEPFVDQEVPGAADLLTTPARDLMRYAGVLTLSIIARTVPVHFAKHVEVVLEKLPVPIRDPRVFVREASADLLALCLDIITAKDALYSEALLEKVFEQAKMGLKSGQVDVIHGSLLTHACLLLHAKMFMKDSFLDTAHTIIFFKHKSSSSSSSSLVQHTVMQLMPVLAEYDTASFVSYHIAPSMDLLVRSLGVPGDRDVAFASIGRLARAVGAEIRPFLDRIMSNVRSALHAASSTSSSPTASTSFASLYTYSTPTPGAGVGAVFECIGMLVQSAVGPLIMGTLHGMLDEMFGCGLSRELWVLLQVVSGNLPALLRPIQVRMLDVLSTTLTGKPFVACGAPPFEQHLPMSKGKGKGKMVNGSGSPKSPTHATATMRDPASVKLALEVLGSFDFSEHTLTEFIRDAALPYISHPNAEVRCGAALTCASLLLRDSIVYHMSQHATEIVHEVLGRLVAVGVADPEPRIRARILEALDAKFDSHLAQAEHTRAILIAANDDVLAVRVAALTLIGRLSALNPSFILPALRLTLAQLIADLQHAPTPRARAESAQLIALVVRTTKYAIQPYARSILAVLLPASNDAAPGVAASALLALGELASAAGGEIEESGQTRSIMDSLLRALEDPAARGKRDAALRALGQVCGGTGYVVKPLVDYPGLHPLLGRMLATETRSAIREEVVKVLGILGAVDPYRRQSPDAKEEDALEATVVRAPGIDVAVPLGGAASEEYYLRVVMAELLEILKNPLRDGAHHVAVEAIMSIFKTQGLSAVVFLPQIIPTFASVIRESTVRYQEFHLQQLAILVSIIGEHVRSYLETLLDLVHALWHVSPPLRLALATLIEALAYAMDTELKQHVPPLVGVLLAGLEPSERPATQMHVLRALVALGGCLEPYLGLVLPPVVAAVADSQDWAVKRTAVQTIEGLASRIQMTPMLGRIAHPFVKALACESEELRDAVMDALCVLGARAGSDYALFIPLVDSAVVRYEIKHEQYEDMVRRMLHGERPVEESELIAALAGKKAHDTSLNGGQELGLGRGANPSQNVNVRALRSAYDTSHITNSQDWSDWLHRLCAELLKESPSPALRSCVSLLHQDTAVADEVGRKLLPVSFLSCWVSITPDHTDNLTSALEIALTHPHTPADVVVTILDLVESMERHNKPLAIDIKVLSKAANSCHAYAAALHYMEQEFLTTEQPRASTVEAIIEVNTKLRQLDAAWGTLNLAREQFEGFAQEPWFEKLGRWHEAYEGYSRGPDPDAVPAALGRMRCLNALGDWVSLSRQAADAYALYDSRQVRQTIAPLGAAAAWALGDWDELEDFVLGMDPDSVDRQFYAAVHAVHRGQFATAAKHISVARSVLDPDLTALIIDDYERGYEGLIRAQMLSELEEVAQYKQASDQPEQQHLLRQTWMKRLRGSQPDIEVWQRLLHVRSLVLSPQDAADMWIKFANLCRKSQRLELAEKVLISLGGREEQSERADPDVIYSFMKFMWAADQRGQAQKELSDFSSELRRDLNRLRAQPVPNGDLIMSETTRAQARAAEKLISRCYLKQAQWIIRGNPSWTETNADAVLRLIQSATTLDGHWWKAWHMWALANIETLGSIEARADYHLDDVDGEILAERAVLAVEGLVHAISLAKKSTLQDILRLLTLWFKFGGHDSVSRTVATSFSRLSVDTWLDVIPQIIARISAPNPLIRANIHALLAEIGKQHPQALIYPLTVASKSPSAPRQAAAERIIDRMREHCAPLVEQALCVSQELIRVAILWHEMWREGLDNASKLYVDRGDIEGMLAVLDPLHDMVEEGPTTADEMAFVHTHGRDLEAAREECRRYLASGNPGDLDRAWILYTTVYRRLERQPAQPIMNLQQVSPYLLNARDLQLAIPGTYTAGKPLLTIHQFSKQLTVLVKSNKKPRKFTIRGSDGQDYGFGLKGHEDLRQDERVMQFFGLVNTLLANDADSVKRHLHVQRFPVIPIAPNAGIMGWVQETDTLHYLIEQYRTSREVLLNLENRLMLQMAPEYDCLTLMQKIEVFEHAMTSTTGMDLYRILWLKSTSASDWLSRRTTYTRSLALTSMLGYVIGLGDRHPSNILIHRQTGMIIHIDFGDCFEIAMHREKYPETVPFRLTRMMVHAMEISTVQGTFRNTSQIALGLMREHRDSLLAVLEALIYDPLISWRLVQPERRTRTRSNVSREGPVQRFRANENEIFGDASDDRLSQQEIRNDRALTVYNRVKSKLTGRDFNPDDVLSVQQQFLRLVQQARSEENLCQLYFGWYVTKALYPPSSRADDAHKGRMLVIYRPNLFPFRPLSLWHLSFIVSHRSCIDLSLPPLNVCPCHLCGRALVGLVTCIPVHLHIDALIPAPSQCVRRRGAWDQHPRPFREMCYEVSCQINHHSPV
ncbi:phosphatidylinositol 3-kinase [Exidia glandulosa HHB12029]|uniref:Serine/threonine-protein kinase TOR n=1 Tax=Exidia glandulosa HHB12029 TaxID=1314781 RepID=A0A165LWZ8_EXIGL|nr:phosphatidylinositol 3-kinase [Exidia glandulosa HHB12029]